MDGMNDLPPMGDEQDLEQESDANQVELSKDALPDAQDGQEVEFTAKGMLQVRPDGSRCVQLTEVDGQPTTQPEAELSEDEKDQGAADNLKNVIGGSYGNKMMKDDSDEMPA